jgi:uncharacterized membrane protein
MKRILMFFVRHGMVLMVIGFVMIVVGLVLFMDFRYADTPAKSLTFYFSIAGVVVYLIGRLCVSVDRRSKSSSDNGAHRGTE